MVNLLKKIKLNVIKGDDDYTNNNLNYRYYDPFILKVEPQKLRDKGSTELKTRENVIDKTTGQTIVHYKKFPVEVTNVNSEEAKVLHLTEYSKAVLKDSLVDSIPYNIDTSISIPVDGTKIDKNLDEINNYANYTCKFEVNGKEKITNGIFTKFPMNNTVYNLFLC